MSEAQSADPARIDGRVAVVTGSTSGIGLAIARRLGQTGASVIVNSRSQERADATAAEFTAEGLRAAGAGADVSTPDGVRALFERTIEKFGTVDILVNNAGRPSVTPSDELSLESWRATLDLNLTGPFLCSQAAGRIMLAKGSGAIVNVSSIFGSVAIPGRLAYGVSKHGLDGLTKMLAAACE